MSRCLHAGAGLAWSGKVKRCEKVAVAPESLC
jgi:hypothetical protein